MTGVKHFFAGTKQSPPRDAGFLEFTLGSISSGEGLFLQVSRECFCKMPNGGSGPSRRPDRRISVVKPSGRTAVGTSRVSCPWRDVQLRSQRRHNSASPSKRFASRNVGVNHGLPANQDLPLNVRPGRSLTVKGSLLTIDTDSAWR